MTLHCSKLAKIKLIQIYKAKSWWKGRCEPWGWHMYQCPQVSDTLQSYNTLRRRLGTPLQSSSMLRGFTENGLKLMTHDTWLMEMAELTRHTWKEVYIQQLISGFQDSKVYFIECGRVWIRILLYYCHLLVNNSIWRFLPWSALSSAKSFMNRSWSLFKKQHASGEAKYIRI